MAAGTSLNPISGTRLRALGKAARTEFMREYETYQPPVMDAGLTIKDFDAEEITLDWLGSPPQMRVYKDEKVPQAVYEYNYTLSYEEYESTLKMSRKDVYHDRYGLIMQRVREMAQVARDYPGERMRTIMAAGLDATYGTCYDGQFFYDVDHSEGETGSQINYAASATVLGGPLSAATLSLCKAAMFKFTDDRNKPLGIVADTIIVPPDLTDTALELVTSDVTTVASSFKKNIYKGLFKVWTWNELTTPAWILACTGGRNRKPMIYSPIPHPYNSRDVFFAFLGPDSETAKMKKDYHATVETNFGIAYGDWRYAFYNKGAA